MATITLEALAPPLSNKHIPLCPTGSSRYHDSDVKPNVPIAEPSPEGAATQRATTVATSLLYPPTSYVPVDYQRQEPASHAERLRSSIYEISPAQVAAALDHAARQPLAEPSMVFPWLHGLHPENRIQQAFFVARRRSLRQPPTCLRGITLVQADGDLSTSRLRGAVAWSEIMDSTKDRFLDVDPRNGLSVRNFHIQTAKAAVTSDIVIYGDNGPSVRRLGARAAIAQARWRDKYAIEGHVLPEYSVFLCIAPFGEFERNHAEIVAVDSSGKRTGRVLDFQAQERQEMRTMTRATEISHNVWLGPTMDRTMDSGGGGGGGDESEYNVMLECNDVGRFDPAALKSIAENTEDQRTCQLELPSSGSVWMPQSRENQTKLLIETCCWIYAIAHGIRPHVVAPPQVSWQPDVLNTPDTCCTPSLDCDGDSVMSEAEKDAETPMENAVVASSTPRGRPRKILIHCTDGYTETTMLAVAYYSYSMGVPVHEAWLALHKAKGRNCFAYPADVSFLGSVEPALLGASPARSGASLAGDIANVAPASVVPSWFAAFDGSFPSRVLDHMYLGNLEHADKPDLLRALGIGQILSVGEIVSWSEAETARWGSDNVCVVRDVQDNGTDSLASEFRRCLDFIDRGRKAGTATLVHCKVGVSRSATICIAEVMRTLKLSFPRAYCFVRARRLNVIIQPHLRFVYELLRWEETLEGAGGTDGWRRELEWSDIAREIATVNRPYIRT